VDSRINATLDAVVRFLATTAILAVWVWPAWRLVWTRDLVPGLAALIAAVWLVPGCLVAVPLVGRPVRRWVYPLTPVASLVGMIVGGVAVAALSEQLAHMSLLLPLFLVLAACVLAWPLAGVLRRRPGAARLLVLAAVAVAAITLLVLAHHADLTQGGRIVRVSAWAAWPFVPGTALGVSSLIALGMARARRALLTTACPTSASS
jgi:hypothetical protein